MRIAGLVAAALIIAAQVTSDVQAQTPGDLRGPAEIPPTSYAGRQYVDSQGCVFIRAGIGGVVTWVPRVDRNHVQVCGRATQAQAPVPVVVAATQPAVAPVAVATSPVVRRTVRTVAPQPAAVRVVPQHVFEARQNTRNVAVPKGYRTVWKDDRLNPHRAERTLAPSLAAATPVVPRGYRAAWDDGRLSTQRARGSARGEAAMGAIWDDGLPRRLRQTPVNAPVITAPNNARAGRSPFWEPPVAAPVAQLSTRSAPGAGTPGAVYVRVASYAGADAARQAAQVLARGGLSLRLGRTGAGASVVLAGPYASAAEAQAVLFRLRRAGYPQAALLR